MMVRKRKTAGLGCQGRLSERQWVFGQWPLVPTRYSQLCDQKVVCFFEDDSRGVHKWLVFPKRSRGVFRNRLFFRRGHQMDGGVSGLLQLNRGVCKAWVE
jgi:hypothetical protein